MDVTLVKDITTETLVEQQTPQGVFVSDHAGLVINELSLFKGVSSRGWWVMCQRPALHGGYLDAARVEHP
jgi:hypothetical protein